MSREPTLADPSARRALDALHDKPLNFDAMSLSNPPLGWHVDDYCTRLPPEPPGPPTPDGSWTLARRLMSDYQFADPSIVHAVYYPDSPLDGRDMLLEGRFLFLRFRFGVRIGGVREGIEPIDGRDAHVWGWNYRTLQGHLEMGQMDYTVCKWPDGGEVQFRIHVVSRAARIPNPVIRLGFRVFGRPMQKRFARHAGQRMQQLTAAALSPQPRLATPPATSRSIRLSTREQSPPRKSDRLPRARQ